MYIKISDAISVNVLMSIKQGALYYMNSQKQTYAGSF